MVGEYKTVLRRIRSDSDTCLLTLSSKLVKDTAFPFKPGERVRIRISGKRLVVEKAE
jgi:hypothetical protein